MRSSTPPGRRCPSGTTHTIEDLSAGTGYEVRVRAINPNGASGWSDILDASTSGPPGPPTNVRLSHMFGHGNVRLHWDEPPDTGTTEITGYTLEWSLGQCVQHGFWVQRPKGDESDDTPLTI